jgi:hypothetical protein
MLQVQCVSSHCPHLADLVPCGAVLQAAGQALLTLLDFATPGQNVLLEALQLQLQVLCRNIKAILKIKDIWK